MNKTIVIVTVTVAVIVGGSYAVANRYSYTKGAKDWFEVRHDNWTGSTCVTWSVPAANDMIARQFTRC